MESQPHTGPQEQPELMMTIQITRREVMAVNLAINYYLRYCKSASPIYETVKVLLEELQIKFSEQLPSSPPVDGGSNKP